MKLMVEYLLEADDQLQTKDENGSLTMTDPLTTVHYATVQIWSH